MISGLFASNMFSSRTMFRTVVNSSTIPHGKLHKRHTMLSFHRVREVIASKIVNFTFIPGSINPADILSKHWAFEEICSLILPMLHQYGDPMATEEETKYEKALENSKKINTKKKQLLDRFTYLDDQACCEGSHFIRDGWFNKDGNLKNSNNKA